MEKLLRLRDVIALTGMSKSYCYQLAKLGEFPKPVRLTSAEKGSVAWISSEVQEFIRQRIAQRDEQEAQSNSKRESPAPAKCDAQEVV